MWNALEEVVLEDQVFWYDHPVQIGVEPDRNEILYGRFIPISELVDQVDSVTPADIVRCAETYFHPESLLIATHGPEMELESE